MSVETVKGEEYEVQFNDETKIFSFAGSLRLRDSNEYQPIAALMQKAYGSLESEDTLLLNFTELKFLNSSGINTISRFIIAARKINKAKISIKGNGELFWQKKSLTNLTRLWPQVEVEIS